MRTATFLPILTLLLATAVAGPVPPLSTCGVGAPVPCVTLVVGDVVVGGGEEQEYNNGTYAFQGNVTVESGGTLEMILSQVSFATPTPVHVESGGTIVIDGSSLTAAPPSPGSPTSVIQLDAGANVVVAGSNFTYLTVSLASDASAVQFNDFRFGAPAVRLVSYSGTFSNNTFSNNAVGLNATGGSPTIHDLAFAEDGMGIELHQVDCVVSNIAMTNVHDGMILTWSQCLMTQMALDDRSLPPTMGIQMYDTAGTTEIGFSDISEFGTGIFYCRADVHIHDNTFSGNGQDVATC